MDKKQQQLPLFPIMNSKYRVNVGSEVVATCKLLQQRIVRMHINNTIYHLIQLCHQEYKDGVCNQIFAINFNISQKDQLPYLLKALSSQFTINMKNVFPSQNPDRILIIQLESSKVRQIVPSMYIQLENNAQQKDLIIFIIQDITDLNDKNISCFEVRLKGKKFISILCNFDNFENQKEHKLYSFQKYDLKLYNSKNVFCQYVYNCLCSPIIKPYLPEQVLSLISDSIPYRQNCKRFTSCVEKYMTKIKKDRTYVAVESLISLIEQLISRTFRIYHGHKQDLEKVLKVILSENERYTIPQSSVASEILLQSSLKKIEENDLMREIQERLRKYMNKQPEFKKYVGILDQYNDQLNTQINLTDKTKLEDQITRIIKEATAGIRSQAAQINWNEIKCQ